jgi:uncharacterized protein
VAVTEKVQAGKVLLKMKDIIQTKSKDLQNEIDLYLKCISRSSLLFFEGAKEAFKSEYEDAEIRYREIALIERDADNHLKSIQYKLHAYNIAPDSRADIFELLDGLDDIVDSAKKIIFQICVEKPLIPDSMKEDYVAITEASLGAVDILLQGVRAFFEDINTLEGYVDNVYLYEKKADNLEEKIKRNIFHGGEVDELARKFQLRYYVEKMALLSDLAEETAKNMLMYKIKRII